MNKTKKKQTTTIDALAAITAKGFNDIAASMATKQDLERLATKQDLKSEITGLKARLAFAVP